MDNFNNKLIDTEIENAFKESLSLSEEIYKSHILPDSSNTTHKDSQKERYRSYELIPFDKIVVLRKILSYILNSEKYSLNENERESAQRNLNVISAILNGIEAGSYTFVDLKGELYLKYNSSYGYVKGHTLGRLFSRKVSINLLSKDFRYYLFKDVYRDIDIVNSHPTILHLYAKNNDVTSAQLERLVYDRENFYNQLFDDYNRMMPRESTKKLVYYCLNKSNADYASPTLTELNSELVRIRELLYEEFYESDNYFRSAINARLDVTNEIEVVKQKVQTLYCSNLETENIMNFKAHLEKKWSDVDISIVPFSGGLFIEDINTHEICNDTFITQEKYPCLEDVINKYNEKSCITFKEKTISPVYRLFSKDTFSRLESVVKYAEGMTHAQAQTLMGKYDLHRDIIEYTQKRVKNQIDQIEKQEEQEDKQSKSKRKKMRKMIFSYEDILDIKSLVNRGYAKLIDILLENDYSENPKKSPH